MADCESVTETSTVLSRGEGIDKRIVAVVIRGYPEGRLKEVRLFSAEKILVFPGESIIPILKAVAEELGLCCHDGADEDCLCYQAGYAAPHRPLGA